MDDEQVAVKIERRDRVRVVQTRPPFIDASGKEVGPREVVIFSGSYKAWQKTGFYGVNLPNTQVFEQTRPRGAAGFERDDENVRRPNKRTFESTSRAA